MKLFIALYKDMRLTAFLLAITLYAFWGTPTPEQISWLELSVGLLLIIAVGIRGGAYALDFKKGTGHEHSARMLLAYGLSIPVLNGIISGNDIMAMARDIIPFLFFLLPLLLQPLLAGYDKNITSITGGVLLLGMVFSGRVLWPYMTENHIISDPFFLANSPAVLFASLLLIGVSGQKLYCGERLSHFLKALLFFALALIPLITMTLITQRASLGAVFLMIILLFIIGLFQKPFRIILPLLGLALLFFITHDLINHIAGNLMHKTSLVGLNMRWQEARAVFDSLDDHFLTVLLGQGWGARILSPAAGGVIVNFTHNLITTYWLKTGLIGVCFVLFYLAHFGILLWRLFFKNPVVALALAAPFLIDIILYASFKSLDFGLLLCLIMLWGRHSQVKT